MPLPRILLARPSDRQARRIARRRQRRLASMACETDGRLDQLQHIVNTNLNGIIGMLEMMLHSDLNGEQRAMLAMAQDTAENLRLQSGRLLQRKSADEPPVSPTVLQQNFAAVRMLLIGASAERPSPALQALHRLGIAIDSFAAPKAALAALEDAAAGAHPYAIVLLEQQLQGLDGETLGTAIGSDATHRDTLLLLLSDTHSADDTERLAQAGFSAWLPQRAPPAMLQDTLNVLCRWVAGTCAPGFVAAGVVVEDDAGKLSANALPFDGSRILAVDDNPVNLHVIERLLARLGCQVDTASGGEQALGLAADHVYDLILMDCQMPGLDGYQTTALLRAAEAGTRHTPIIGWSARTRRRERDTCLAIGMDDFVAKPVHLQTLRQLLARWLPPPANDGAAEGGDELEATQQMFGCDFTELAQLFLADTPQRLAALQAALAAADTAAFAKVAHALCGSSASIGASALAAICRELEIRARNGIAAEPARMQAIAQEYARIDAKLRHMMHSAGAPASPTRNADH
ncbi:MAG TPA: response regulator [Oxalicibacterium sp.]|nr:response regulator [Oxalicibacterium sp.]